MPTDEIRAVSIDRSAPDPLAVRTARLGARQLGEIAIRVTAISLNRGEVKRALTVMENGVVPGWDLAGVVEETFDLPGAPAVGTRVVGVVPSGSWAERLYAPLSALDDVAGKRDVGAGTSGHAVDGADDRLRQGAKATSTLERSAVLSSSSSASGLLAAWLAPFACLFTRPTWGRVPMLIEGTLLALHRRTVSAA